MTPQAQDPLAQLADIHLPPAVPSFPWGWAANSALLVGIIVLAVAVFWAWRRYQQRAYRRAALAELAALAKLQADDQLAPAVGQLLRRVVHHAYGKTGLSLHGEAWHGYLNQCCKKPVFAPGRIQELEAASYQAAATLEDRQALLAETRQWISKHRRAR